MTNPPWLGRNPLCGIFDQYEMLYYYILPIYQPPANPFWAMDVPLGHAYKHERRIAVAAGATGAAPFRGFGCSRKSLSRIVARSLAG